MFSRVVERPSNKIKKASQAFSKEGIASSNLDNRISVWVWIQEFEFGERFYVIVLCEIIIGAFFPKGKFGIGGWTKGEKELEENMGFGRKRFKKRSRMRNSYFYNDTLNCLLLLVDSADFSLGITAQYCGNFADYPL